ncbi:MAG: D-aminoacylase [Acidobacteriaceae bacterium]|nr:D-aminoacylase [Acidobacteriaceae bacterium]
MFRALLLLALYGIAHAQTLDLLLTGGTVVDGSGAPGRIADVGIRGDRIAFIGDAASAHVQARRSIAAKGLIVSPGFIDPHTHTLDDLSSARRANENYLLQGVTTVITGNDGGGPVNTGKILQQWRTHGIGTNAGLYIGQGAIRGEVMGMTDAAPTPQQLDAMERLVKSGMEAGAFGLSAGLFYAPGSYAKTDEVIALAKVAAKYGGVYDTHIRDESTYSIGVMGAIQEAIDIAKGAGIPLHISHIKVQGPAVWGKSDAVIALIRKAQAQGVRISADQYPYTGSGTSLTASLVPRWAQVGGNQKMLDRFSDPAERPKVIADMEKNLDIRGGPDRLLVTSARDRALVGKTLDQIAKQRGLAPAEAAIAIIRTGGAGIASLNIDERDIENFMKQEFVTTGSDGSTGHPRKYGTFPRKLRIYVREKHILTLEQFVQRSSAQTADDLHIANRGQIKEGYFADIVAFDYDKITDQSTYEHPEVLSNGVQFVIVNGKVAVENGKYTGALAGQALRR